MEKYVPLLIGHLRNTHPVEFLLAERLSTFLSSELLLVGMGGVAKPLSCQTHQQLR